jgi:hypothetical protein
VIHTLNTVYGRLGKSLKPKSLESLPSSRSRGCIGVMWAENLASAIKPWLRRPCQLFDATLLSGGSCMYAAVSLSVPQQQLYTYSCTSPMLCQREIEYRECVKRPISRHSAGLPHSIVQYLVQVQYACCMYSLTPMPKSSRRRLYSY